MNNKYDTDINNLINKIEIDIENTEYLIKNKDKIDHRKKIIKNLKITSHIAKLLIPFIVLPVMTYHGFAYRNRSPFILDDVKESKRIIREIDSYGHIKESFQYSDFNEKLYNVIYIYDEWKPIDDNIYERVAKKYYIVIKNNLKNIFSMSDSEIIAMINQKDFLENNFIVDSGVEMIETTNNINDVKQQNGQYVKIVIYDENEDVYIIREQYLNENLVDIIFYIILTALLEDIISIILKKPIKKIRKKVDQINDEYIPVNVELLEKKLQIKRDNYRRLMG